MNSDPTSSITILTDDQIENWLDQSAALRGEDHLRRLIGFAQDMQDGRRIIWTARDGDRLLGQVTLQHESEYPPFRKGGIFEIVDLWVDHAQRRNGVGRGLLNIAIEYARARHCPAVGLGCGVTANFGAAHCLYASRGFMPDGSGLWVQGHQAKMDETVTLGEGVLMMWVKAL